MERRNFIKTTAAAGSLAALSPFVSFAQDKEKNFTEEEINSIRSRIKPITVEGRELRMEQARRHMRDNNIDLLLMEGGTSMTYYCGAHWGRSERLFAMMLPQKGEPIFIAPKFEEGRAKEQTGSAKLFTWQEDESPYEVIQKALKENNLLSAKVGIEETTRFFVSDNLRKTISTLELTSGTPVTAACRSVKTAHEVELMQIANDIAIAVFRAAVEKLEEGMTENKFGEIITDLFAEFGVEGGALVLFGKASAFPHGLTQENTLKKGDIVLLDGGCSVEGYQSDITRTTVFGKPTAKMKKVWGIVRKAQDEALKIASPATPAESIDGAARKVIDKGGYGPGFKYFTHRLGHGIGMDGHEWYYLVKGSKRPVIAGNMFSNEPGIYIINEFGIRLEDEMLITENGARLLLPQQESLEKI
jgi:Xaa-Pro dipeptidase